MDALRNEEGMPRRIQTASVTTPTKKSGEAISALVPSEIWPSFSSTAPLPSTFPSSRTNRRASGLVPSPVAEFYR